MTVRKLTANPDEQTCRLFIVSITLASSMKGELHSEVFNGHFRFFQVTGFNGHFKVIKTSYPIKYVAGKL